MGLVVEVGVPYNSDLDSVVRGLREVADESPYVLKTPKPDVLLSGFGDSAWNMELRVWLPDPYRYYFIRSEINCAIVRKFRQRGIEIPFPRAPGKQDAGNQDIRRIRNTHAMSRGAGCDCWGMLPQLFDPYLLSDSI